MKLSYEPAAVSAALAVLFQAAALFGWLPKAFQAEQVANALVLVSTALAGLYARSRAYPAAKIEDAAIADPGGFSPDAIERTAHAGRRRKQAAKQGDGRPSV